MTEELERLRAADKPVGTKERNTFLKWILGMAVIANYGYDHHAARSPVPKEIADDLAALGISLDEDTIRSKLREGAEEYGHLLPLLTKLSLDNRIRRDQTEFGHKPLILRNKGPMRHPWMLNSPIAQ